MIKKKILIPKDWGFFKRKIKYRKCINDFRKSVGFGGLHPFIDNCLEKQDKIWDKRKNFVKKVLWHTIPILIIGIILNIFF